MTRLNSIEKFIKRLLGETDLEAILHRLDRLTPDEARATAAQSLEAIYSLVQKMRVIMDGELALPEPPPAYPEQCCS